MELRRLAASLLWPESQSCSATSVPFLGTGCKRTMLPQEGRGSFKGVRSSSSGSRVTCDIVIESCCERVLLVLLFCHISIG